MFRPWNKNNFILYFHNKCFICIHLLTIQPNEHRQLIYVALEFIEFSRLCRIHGFEMLVL